MSISVNLASLKLAKEDIAEAITAKGVSVGESDGFSSFAEKIMAIKPPSNYGLITFTAADPAAANIKIS